VDRGRAASRSPLALAREFAAARPYLAALAVAVCATAGLTVAQASVAAALIARVVEDHPPLAKLGGELGLLVALVCGRALASGLAEWCGRAAAAAAARELRDRLASALLDEQGWPLSRGRHEGGRLVSLALQGADGLTPFFAGYLPQLLLATLVPVLVVGYLTALDPIAGVLIGLTVPLLILFMVLVGKGAAERARERERTLELLGGHFLDVVLGLTTVKAFCREQVQEGSIARSAELYRQATNETLRLAFLSALVLELVAMIGMALVAVVVGIQLDAGTSQLRVGLTALLLAPELYGALRNLGQRYHQGADGLAGVEQLLELVEARRQEQAGAEPPAGRLAPRLGGAPLVARGLAYAYPDRPAVVLERVDLELEPGTLTVIDGDSGSGKSTLGLVLAGLLAPTAGSLTWGGWQPQQLGLRRWRSAVAILGQRPTVYAGTLLDNVGLYAPGADHQLVRGALEAALLGQLEAQLPGGLLGRVGEGGRALSAGEAQRLGFARVLASAAKLLVLDEPLAHLEQGLAVGLAERICGLARQRTVVVLAHGSQDPAVGLLFEAADQRLTLAGGRLRESASASVTVGGGRW